MRAHPLQSNVNPSAASVLSPSLNQQSIYSNVGRVSVCVCMCRSCVHVHTNEMTISDHKTEPGETMTWIWGICLMSKSNRQDLQSVVKTKKKAFNFNSATLRKLQTNLNCSMVKDRQTGNVITFIHMRQRQKTRYSDVKGVGSAGYASVKSWFASHVVYFSLNKRIIQF